MAKSFFKLKAFKRKKPKFLQGIKVQSLSGDMIVLSSLWDNTTIILKVLRRFGCPLCRYGSRLLSNLKPEFDKMNVKLIGIGFEEVGLQEFMDGKYWEWELFPDLDRSVHKALGLQKMSIFAGLSDLLTSASRKAVNAVNKLGIQGDFNGDGFQLGGTFVVGAGDRGLLYEYRQTGAALYPSIKEIFEAVGGDSSTVDDMAPAECIFYQESVAPKSRSTSFRSGATDSETGSFVTRNSSRFNDSEIGSVDSLSVYS